MTPTFNLGIDGLYGGVAASPRAFAAVHDIRPHQPRSERLGPPTGLSTSPWLPDALRSQQIWADRLNLPGLGT